MMEVFRKRPLHFWLGLLGVVLLARRRQRRDLRDIERIGRDLGTYYGTRDREARQREERLLVFTRTLARLTFALLAVTAITLVVIILRG